MGERLLHLITDWATGCRLKEQPTWGCCTYNNAQGLPVCKDTDPATCKVLHGDWESGLCDAYIGHGLPEFDEADIKKMVSILDNLNRNRGYPQPEGSAISD